MGDDPNGTGLVTVTGIGSTWTNSSDLRVGLFQGYGTLNITGGGAVSNFQGVIGNGDFTQLNLGATG